MATTFQIVDPDDLSTILFDFNDSTGANNATYASSVATKFGVGYTIDLGTPERTLSQFEPAGADGGVTAFVRDGLAQTKWRQIITATSTDNLVAGVGFLQRLLRAGCVIKYVPDGGTLTKYIDVEPSTAVALLDGSEFMLYQVTSRFTTEPDGVELALWRQPYLRGAELDPTVNLLVNSTLLANAAGTPTSWTSVAGTHSIQQAQEAYQNSHTAVTNLLTQNETVGGNGTYTLSAYARRVSGSGQGALRVSSVGGAGSTDSSPINTTTWTRYTATVTTTGATTAVQAALRQGSASGTTVLQFKNVQLELAASASTYRVGEETLLADPANGLGCRMPVYIQGDAPAALTIVSDPSVTTTQGIIWGLLGNEATIPGKTAITNWITNPISQFESWTNSTDTAGVVDANASPGSGTSIKRTTYVTTPTVMQLRAFTAISDASQLAILRGRRWNVLIRISMTAATDPHQVKVAYTWGDAAAAGDTRMYSNTITVVGNTPYGWFNMGTVSFPDTAPDALGLTAHSARVSGGSNLNWDVLMFVPADVFGESGSISSFAAGQWVRVDGQRGFIDGADSSLNVVIPANAFSLAGQFPVAQPGLNGLAILPDQGLGNETLAATRAVRVYHTPRYYA
jgi:hypothetical protein